MSIRCLSFVPIILAFFISCESKNNISNKDILKEEIAQTEAAFMELAKEKGIKLGYELIEE